MEKHKVDFYNIPIVDYLLSIGEPLESVGHNYYQHKHHDSLKINQRKNGSVAKFKNQIQGL